MMRKVLSGILILAICLQTVGGAFLHFWHMVDRASFEKVFCINLDRPQLNCHAQCTLSKLDAAQENKEIPQAHNEEENKRNVFFQEGLAYDNSLKIPLQKSSLNLNVSKFHGRLFALLVFHPPKAGLAYCP